MKDGAYKEISDVTFEVLNDSAKGLFTLYPLAYQSDSSTLTILEASIDNEGKVQVVPADKMVEGSVVQGQAGDSPIHRESTI